MKTKITFIKRLGITIVFMSLFSFIGFSQCNYTLKMDDSYGDGWNSNTIDVLVNGIEVLDDVTLSNGSTANLTFSASTGDNITTLWNGGGSFPNETSYEILDPANTVVGSGAATSITIAIVGACPSCMPPTNQTVSNISTISAQLNWTTGGATDFAIEYGPTGFTQGTGTYVSVATDNFKVLTGLTNGTTYQWYVKDSCSTTDVSTWAGPNSFKTLAATQSVPFTDGFEVDLSAWNISGTTAPVLSTTKANSGSSSADMLNSAKGKDVEMIATFTATADPLLSFSYYVSYYYYNNFKVSIQEAGTTSWTELHNFNTDYGTTSDDAKWLTVTDIDLATYDTESGEFKLKFYAENTYTSSTYNVYLDDILLAPPPTCPKPTNQIVTNISADGAQLNWTSGGANNSAIEYGPTGFTQGTGTHVAVANDTLKIISSLTAKTSYEWYVKDSCGTTDVSFWNGPNSFSTTAATQSVPFTDGFEVDLSAWNISGTTAAVLSSTQTYSGSNSASMLNSATGKEVEMIATFSATANPRLSFSYYVDDYSYNKFIVYIQESGSSTWSELHNFNTDYGTITDDDVWLTVTEINLASYDTESGEFKLKFYAKNTNYNSKNVYLDDILLALPPTCPEPYSQMITNLTTTSAKLNWITGGATDFAIEYGPTGFTQGTGTQVAVATDNFKIISGLTINTAYEWYVKDSCSTTDVSTWTGPNSFSTLATTQTVPFIEGFEVDLSAWQITGTTTPVLSTTQINNGSKSLNMINDGKGKDIEMIVNFSSSSDPLLSFSYYVEYYSNKFNVSIQESGSSTWTVLHDFSTSYGSYNDDDIWITITEMDLATYDTESGEFKLKFFAENNSTSYANNVFLDDISLIPPPTCPEPTSPIVTDITTSGAKLNWTSGGATNFAIEYGSPGFTQGTGTYIAVANDNFKVLSGLTSGTNYEWYIKDSCGTTDVSTWNGPNSFATLAATQSVPFTDGFEVDLSAWNISGTTAPVLSTTKTYSGSNSADMLNSATATNVEMTATFSATTDPLLSFSYYVSYASLNNFIVSIQEAGSTSWIELHNFSTDYGNSSDANQWLTITEMNLATYNTESGEFKLKFYAENTYSYAYNVYLDDVILVPLPTCPKPTSPIVTDLSTYGAKLNWTTGGATNFAIEYGSPGFTQGMGTHVAVVTDNFKTISGLTAKTPYEWYVKDSCGTTDVSAWVGPNSFVTLAPTQTVPFTEGFEVDLSAWSMAGTATPVLSTTKKNSGTNSLSMLENTKGKNAEMIVNFSPATDPLLSFSYNVKYYSDNNFIVSIQEAGSSTWTILHEFNTNYGTSSDDDKWLSITNLDIATYDTESGEFKLKFYAESINSSWNRDVYLDDVSLIYPITCPEPTSPMVTDLSATGAKLNWTTGGATDFAIEYGIAGFTQGSGTYMAVSTDNFKVITGLIANTDYQWYVKDSCGNNDFSTWNGPNSFKTPAATQSVPFTDGFEVDLSAWNISGTTAPVLSQTTVNTGSNSVNMLDETKGKYVDMIATFSATTDPLLSFSYYVEEYYSNEFKVFIQVANSSTWTTLHNFYSDYGTSNDDDVWLTITDLDLATYDTESGEFKLKFYAKNTSSSWNRNVYLDDISLIPPPTCPEPTNQTVTDITSSGAKLNWTTGGATNFAIEYGPTGFTKGQGTYVAVATDAFKVIDMLLSGTIYDWYVHDSCAANDVSTWAGPNTFSTICDVISSFPYTENFENGVVPICWNETRIPSSSTYGWSSNTNSYIGKGAMFNSSNNTSGNVSELSTVTFDLTSLTTARLKFEYKNPVGGDLSVLLSTDNGATFSNTIASNLVGQADWTQKTIDITSYIGSTVVVKFVGISNYVYNSYIYLDEVTVEAIPVNEVEVTEIIGNYGSIGADNYTVSATISNNGSKSQSNVPINFTLDGGTVVSETIASLPAFTTTTYTFTAQVNSGAAGSHTLAVYSTLANEELNTNDTAYITVENLFPYSEGFESYSAGDLPNYWNAINNTGNISSLVETQYYASYANSGNLSFKIYNENSTTGDLIAVLPKIVNGLSGLQLSFWARSTESDIIIGVMTDPTDESTFTTIKTIDDALTTYSNYIVNIDSYTGSGKYIAFKHGMTTTYDYINIDDIYIGATPIVDLGNDTAICAGSSITLDAGAGYTYSWTNDGYTTELATTQTISPNSVGTYIVKIDDGNLVNYDTIVITNNPLPTVVLSGNNTICIGDSSEITAAFTGATPWDIVISTNGTSSSQMGLTTPFSTYKDPSVSTDYIITQITDANGCVQNTASNTINIAVNALPIVNLTSLTDVCASTLVNLTGGTPSTGWFTGTEVDSTNSTFDATAAGAGTYDISYNYTDANGCTNSAQTSQLVNGLPTVDLTLNDICADASIFGLSGGTPTGGTYSGINVDASGNFDPTNGTQSITYSYTDGNSCTNSIVTNQIVNALPDVTIVVGSNPIPYNTSTSLSANVTNGVGTLSYDWSPGISINGDSTIQSTNTINIIATTYYTVEVTDATTNCVNSNHLLLPYSGGPVSVNPALDFTSICTGDTANINAGGAGGTATLTYSWTSNPSGFTSTNEAPQVMPTVDTWYIVVATDGSSSDKDSIKITVNALPNVTFSGLNATYCENDIASDLIPSITGGIFTGIGVNGSSFNPATTTAGNFDVTYLYTDANGCSNTVLNSTVVNALPTVFFTGLDASYCSNNSDVTLIPNITGGTFTGAGITDNTFSPSTAGLGNLDITYSYTDVNNCTNTDVNSTIINDIPIVTFTGLDASYCINNSDDTLVPYTNGGIFTGTSLITNIFSPSAAGIGSFDVTYSYTDANGCANSDTVSTTVHSLPIVSFTGLDSTYCSNNIEDTLVPNTTGGTFTGAGITANVFSPSTAGVGNYEIVYSYTDMNNCTNYDTNSTAIIALPMISFTGLGASYCSNNNDVTLIPNINGGTFTGAGITTNTFSPSTAGAGDYNVVYSYTDTNNCTNTDTNSTIVYASPIKPSFTGLAATYCEDATSVSLTPSATGGIFTGIGISGSDFDPSTAGVGTFDIIYTIIDTNSCSNADTNSTIVNALPNIIISGLATDYCLNASMVTLTSSPTSGSWSGATTNGDFNPTNIGAQTIIYTFTDDNGCANTDSVTTMVNALPTVTLTSLADVCVNANNFMISGASPAGGNWSGNGVSSNYFNATNAGAGSHYLVYTYTDANGCSDFDSTTQLVNSLPVLNITGLDAAYCANADNDTLSATPIGGSFTGVGITANVFDPSVPNSGSVSVMYMYTDAITGCINSESATTMVNAIPMVDLGADNTVCENNSSMLDAGNTGASFLWNTGATTQTMMLDTNGNGIGDVNYSVVVTDVNMCTNIDSVMITYEALPVSQLTDTNTICGENADITLDAGSMPGNTYVWSNGVSLSSITIDSTDLGGTTGNMSVEITSVAGCIINDTTYVYFRELPVVDLGGDQLVCINHEFTIDAGAGFTSYLWNTGATTQQITIDSNTFVIGNNLLKVEVYNDVNCNAMDSMILVVDPCTGVEMPELANADINIYPNPTKGQFQIDVIGLENEEYNLDIYNSVGAVVYSDKVSNDSSNKQTWKLDFSTYAKGLYYVRLHSNGDIKVKRIVIN